MATVRGGGHVHVNTGTWASTLLVWDAVFYGRIATHGYEYEQFYAFLPLWPGAQPLSPPPESPKHPSHSSAACLHRTAAIPALGAWCLWHGTQHPLHLLSCHGAAPVCPFAPPLLSNTPCAQAECPCVGRHQPHSPRNLAILHQPGQHLFHCAIHRSSVCAAQHDGHAVLGTCRFTKAAHALAACCGYTLCCSHSHT